MRKGNKSSQSRLAPAHLTTPGSWNLADLGRVTSMEYFVTGRARHVASGNDPAVMDKLDLLSRLYNEELKTHTRKNTSETIVQFPQSSPINIGMKEIEPNSDEKYVAQLLERLQKIIGIAEAANMLFERASPEERAEIERMVLEKSRTLAPEQDTPPVASEIGSAASKTPPENVQPSVWSDSRSGSTGPSIAARDNAHAAITAVQDLELPRLPDGLIWPKQYTKQNFPDFFGKRGGIVKYLQEWQPIIAAGKIDMFILRQHFKSAADAISNATKLNSRTGERLVIPRELTIPLRRGEAVKQIRPATDGPGVVVTSARQAEALATRVRRGKSVPGITNE